MLLVETITVKPTPTDPTKPDVSALARLIGAHTPYDGIFELRVPGVHAIKVSRPSTQATHAIQHPSVCIVAQGAKSVMIGDDLYEYEAAQVAVYSVDIPIASQITRASHAEPYLNLKIDVDPEKIADLAAKVFPHGLPQPREVRPLYIGAADPHIVDAGVRLIGVMDRATNAELIAPLIIDEILIRLLGGPMGARIAQMGLTDSSFHRIAKAVAWLRENFDQPADVEELARLVNMSLSTFHRQFRAVTSLSPLEFQKALRLQEARRLMLTSMLDVSAAARRVGYMSASQFTREYGRAFGSPPTKDIHRLREEGFAVAEAPP
jgi:AraC-like DNA-binding protein